MSEIPQGDFTQIEERIIKQDYNLNCAFELGKQRGREEAATIVNTDSQAYAREAVLVEALEKIHRLRVLSQADAIMAGTFRITEQTLANLDSRAEKYRAVVEAVGRWMVDSTCGPMPKYLFDAWVEYDKLINPQFHKEALEAEEGKQ